MSRWVSRTLPCALSLALPLVAGVAACHHDTSARTTPPPVTAAPAPEPPKAPPAQREEAPVPVSTNLRAGTDLVQQCGLHAVSAEQAAPKFDFDRAELTAQDRAVLEQVANCVTRGPLRGKRLQLVGRADPRGTDEYNLGLGDRRARSVSTYLERLGVVAGSLSASTRGALDATGRDESGWQIDRRVDLAVAD